MLVSEIKKITKDSLQATRIVESIENGDSEVFKDFDLSTFMEHFNMNAVEKITLASAFKKSSKSDLRTKGMSSRLVVYFRCSLTSRQPMR